MTVSAARAGAPDTATQTYDGLSRLLHWTIGLAVIALLAAGFLNEYAPMARETGTTVLGWHKSVGALVLGLGLWRMVRRVAQGFPSPVATTSPRQERLARALHWSLLGLVVVLPLTGLAMTIFAGHPINIFGVVSIPAAAEVPTLAGAARALNGLLGTLLALLVSLHIGAALKHHLIDRDATLVRMITGRFPTAR